MSEKTYVTAHFTWQELACRCCDVMPFGEPALRALESLRVAYGKPMQITSGYRCPKHNAAVSKTGATGPHTVFTNQNIAVDVLLYGRDAYDFVRHAQLLGFTGIGVRQSGPFAGRFIHIDRIQGGGLHPRPWLWTY